MNLLALDLEVFLGALDPYSLEVSLLFLIKSSVWISYPNLGYGWKNKSSSLVEGGVQIMLMFEIVRRKIGNDEVSSKTLAYISSHFVWKFKLDP